MDVEVKPNLFARSRSNNVLRSIIVTFRHVPCHALQLNRITRLTDRWSNFVKMCVQNVYLMGYNAARPDIKIACSRFSRVSLNLRTNVLRKIQFCIYSVSGSLKCTVVLMCIGFLVCTPHVSDTLRNNLWLLLSWSARKLTAFCIR